eukprot:TRINITY_DN9638_c0_g1_i1.p1 TRINITY_DN9638_c0_g1~~TRINITY_DN9638_c0_g1_i1.p1  ORF type:complete len:508 (+),score=42.60 TRINITY_DN9638_c0_g1_i1:33-1556(+)
MLKKLVSATNISIPKDTTALQKRWTNNLQTTTQHLVWYYGWIISVFTCLVGFMLKSDFAFLFGVVLMVNRGLQVYFNQGGRGWKIIYQIDILLGLGCSVMTGDSVEVFLIFFASCIVIFIHATLWEEFKPVTLRHPEKKVLPIKEGASTKETVRCRVVQELYETEAKYIDYLTLAMTLFMERFEEEADKPEPIITIGEVRDIFSSIAVIQNYSKALHDSLRNRLDEWDNDTTKIGDIILDLSHFMKTYHSYVTNYTHAINTLSTCQKNPQFSELLQVCEDDSRLNGEGLSSLLIMPIQRLLRYVMLLNKIVELTPEKHPDLENLKEALKCMSDIADKVNKSRDAADELNKLYRIQCKIDRNFPLLAPARCLVRESRLLKWNEKAKKWADLYYYLFNDMLLEVNISRTISVARDLISSGAPKMTYSSHIQFDGGSTVEKHATLESAFVVCGCKDPEKANTPRVSYILKPSISTEFDMWFRIFEEAVASTRKTYIFFSSRSRNNISVKG